MVTILTSRLYIFSQICSISLGKYLLVTSEIDDTPCGKLVAAHCKADTRKSVGRQQQQELTSVTQYNTAQAKDLKMVYKLIKAFSFQLVTRQVTSYSSED